MLFALEVSHFLKCAWFKCFLQMTLARIPLQDYSICPYRSLEVFPAAQLRETFRPAC